MTNRSGPDRQRAYRVRALIRKGEPITPEDEEFLREYEGDDDENKGASATSRKLSFDLEENAMAVGTGTAAEVAANLAAGSVAHEEGRRPDYLALVGMQALVKACELHERMASTLLARTTQLEEVHLSMLDAVREQYLARTQAEIDAMQNNKDPDDNEGINGMIAAIAKPLLDGAMKQEGKK